MRFRPFNERLQRLCSPGGCEGWPALVSNLAGQLRQVPGAGTAPLVHVIQGRVHAFGLPAAMGPIFRFLKIPVNFELRPKTIEISDWHALDGWCGGGAELWAEVHSMGFSLTRMAVAASGQ